MTTAVEAGRGGRLPRVARRRQLLAAAQEVFVAQGYHGAAMDDIAERAGVSKPVLYQHFPGKLELYLALIDAHTDALVATFGMRWPPRGQSRARARSPRRVLRLHRWRDGQWPGRVPTYFRDRSRQRAGGARRVERADRAIMRAVSDTVSADTGLSRPQAELLAIALTGAAQVAARWWLDNDRPVPTRCCRSLIASLQWRGISNFPLLEAGMAPDRRISFAVGQAGCSAAIGGDRRVTSDSVDDATSAQQEVLGWRSRSACCTRRARSWWTAIRPPTRLNRRVSEALKSVDGQLCPHRRSGSPCHRPGESCRVRRDRAG